MFSCLSAILSSGDYFPRLLKTRVCQDVIVDE